MGAELNESSFLCPCSTGGEENQPLNVDDDENEDNNNGNGSGSSITPQAKKKRGRKPKSQAQRQSTSSSQSGKKEKAGGKKEVEEDVCFFCYDGGNLVICDRKTCPKAYHPSCVGKDEAFFNTRGSWYCGWHACSSCEKPAKLQCYTCTYSVCKGCIREAEFVCIKRNKGFCEICLQLVLMIEENKDVNSDGVKVDFNDRETHEYLFKDYWLEIRDNLSLTLEEIQKAKNPYKDAEFLEDVESDETFDEDNASSTSSDSGSDHLVDEYNVTMKRRRRSKTLASGIQDDLLSEQEPRRKEKLVLREFSGWASKELLEFIRYLKEDTEKAFSIFDVQRLLLQYIKQNKLQDPRRKSVITCDKRLQSLFGKPTVGRFEMLKLLESHFSSKQSCFAEGDASCDNQEEPQDDNDEFGGTKEKVGKIADMGRFADRRRKSRKKSEDKAPRPNPNDYAAINAHNIGLIYLRRTLIEDLLEDPTNFDLKIIGSFVRIRTSGVGNRQEVFYRLVEVVGSRKTGEAYHTGRKTTDIVLEIMNLNKKEDVSIDGVSNQDFTEEECKRLRQSVRCGLVTRPTVGVIEEKAKALHEVKLNDWFETELLRLSHLRDRASEKGLRKELRECVEKLQLLSSPDERARKLQETPEVIADPNVDLDYESDDKEDKLKGSNQGTDSNQWDNSKRGWDSVQQISGKTWDKNKNSTSLWGQSGRKSSHNLTETHNWSHDHHGNTDVNNDFTSWNWGKEKAGDKQFTGWDSQKGCAKMDNQSNIDKSLEEKNIGKSNGWSGSYAGIASLDSSSGWQQERDQTHKPTAVAELSIKPDEKEVSETEKNWHYKDPTGTIQGPFSMLQLCKWSMKGYFPPDLRIWKTHETQEDSILLTDAIAGNFQKKSNSWEANTQFDQTFRGPRTVMNNENPGSGWMGNPGMGLEQDNKFNSLNLQMDSNSVPSTSAIELKSTNDGWVVPQDSGHTWATLASKDGLNGVPTGSESMRTPLTIEAFKSANVGWDAGRSEVNNPKSSGSWGGPSSEGCGVIKSSSNTLSSNTAEASNCAGASFVSSQVEGWVAPKDYGSSWETPASLVETPRSTNTGWGGSQLTEPSAPANAGWSGTQVSESPVSTNAGWGGSQKAEPPASLNTGWGGSQKSEPPASLNTGWGGSQISEVPMSTRQDGDPTKGWGANQYSNSSCKVSSAVTVETPKLKNGGWSGPQSAENMLSASLSAEPPNSMVDGWGAAQNSENAWPTTSVVDASKSTNKGWGEPQSPANTWPRTSEVEATKSANDGWGVPQNCEKSWTTPSVVETSKPMNEVGNGSHSEGWGGWNQSGRTENKYRENVAGKEPRSSQISYIESGSIGKFRNRPPHDGSRSRNSKKDIPCKFHGRGFCKRGTGCEFRHG